MTFKLYIVKVLNLISFGTSPHENAEQVRPMPQGFLLHDPGQPPPGSCHYDCFAILTRMLHASLLQSCLTAYFLQFDINGIQQYEPFKIEKFYISGYKQLHVEHLA